ncbi:MAG: hypothetical protein GY817_09380 [bacterium]|nr:hypothetical protein [bacterium]
MEHKNEKLDLENNLKKLYQANNIILSDKEAKEASSNICGYFSILFDIKNRGKEDENNGN